jgi:hypothetical protein
MAEAECRTRPLNVRKSIDSLSTLELADFRRAVKQALNDKRVPAHAGGSA